MPFTIYWRLKLTFYQKQNLASSSLSEKYLKFLPRTSHSSEMWRHGQWGWEEETKEDNKNAKATVLNIALMEILNFFYKKYFHSFFIVGYSMQFAKKGLDVNFYWLGITANNITKRGVLLEMA